MDITCPDCKGTVRLAEPLQLHYAIASHQTSSLKALLSNPSALQHARLHRADEIPAAPVAEARGSPVAAAPTLPGNSIWTWAEPRAANEDEGAEGPAEAGGEEEEQQIFRREKHRVRMHTMRMMNMILPRPGDHMLANLQHSCDVLQLCKCAPATAALKVGLGL
jgi:hypothetical protein